MNVEHNRAVRVGTALRDRPRFVVQDEQTLYAEYVRRTLADLGEVVFAVGADVPSWDHVTGLVVGALPGGANALDHVRAIRTRAPRLPILLAGDFSPLEVNAAHLLGVDYVCKHGASIVENVRVFGTRALVVREDTEVRIEAAARELGRQKSFTSRETQVAGLLARGCETVGEVADELGLKPSYVTDIVKSAAKKLRVSGRLRIGLSVLEEVVYQAARATSRA